MGATARRVAGIAMRREKGRNLKIRKEGMLFMGTAVVFGILLVCCFIGLRSMVKRVAHGCCGSSGDVARRVKPADKELSHYPYAREFLVEGMTCGACKRRVENALNAMAGVYATVNLRKNLVTVHSKERLGAGEVRRAVLAAGYDIKESGS